MYPCEQQGSGNSFPRGLARVKQLISFKKEAGRGFVSWLLVTAGEDQPKTGGGPGAAFSKAWVCSHIPPVLAGYGGMQPHPLALGDRGKLHGEENKNAQLRFSS